MKRKILRAILESTKKNLANLELIDYISKSMFEFATEKGLPPEIFLDKLKENDKKINKERELLIISGYFDLCIQHKRKSGSLEKNIKKQIESYNRKLYDFIKKGTFETL